MENIKETPIYYNGNKLKCIKKGLLNHFPKNINILIEPFCGSGVISLNTQAKKYILNDIETNLIDLYNMFKDEDMDSLRLYFDKIRKELNFLDFVGDISFDNRSKNYDKEKHSLHKKSYGELRDLYNKTRDIRLLYLLLVYSFSHNMRFNSKNEFNMPCGKDHFNNKVFDKIISFNKFLNNNKLKIFNKDYKHILNYCKDKLNENDFIYIDPPYLITLGTYNENNGWNEDDERTLYMLLDELNEKGIKFGLSNVLTHKGKENTILKEFIKKYNYTDIDVTYSAMGKGNANSKEIYVYNY